MALEQGTVLALPGLATLQELAEVLVLCRDFPAWAVWFPRSGRQWIAVRAASARAPGPELALVWARGATVAELAAMMRVADHQIGSVKSSGS